MDERDFIFRKRNESLNYLHLLLPHQYWPLLYGHQSLPLLCWNVSLFSLPTDICCIAFSRSISVHQSPLNWFQCLNPLIYESSLYPPIFASFLFPPTNASCMWVYDLLLSTHQYLLHSSQQACLNPPIFTALISSNMKFYASSLHP